MTCLSEHYVGRGIEAAIEPAHEVGYRSVHVRMAMSGLDGCAIIGDVRVKFDLSAIGSRYALIAQVLLH